MLLLMDLWFSGLAVCLVHVLLLAFDALIWNCIIVTVVRDRWPWVVLIFYFFFSQAGRERRDDLSCVIQPMKNTHSQCLVWEIFVISAGQEGGSMGRSPRDK